MLLKEGIDKETLSKYLEEYFDTYNDYLPNIYKSVYQMNYLSGLYDQYVDSTICQFYKEYNLLKEEADMYNAFVNIIKHKHPDLSDKTILDVGSGFLPQLGRELAKYSKHVISIDKNVIDYNNPSNLEVIKKDVISYKDLPDADIIVGLLPCEATPYIIDKSCDIGSDFIIALCTCIHDPKLQEQLRRREITRLQAMDQMTKNNIYYAYNKVHENNMGELVEYESPYNFPSKVIGNRR